MKKNKSPSKQRVQFKQTNQARQPPPEVMKIQTETIQTTQQKQAGALSARPLHPIIPPPTVLFLPNLNKHGTQHLPASHPPTYQLSVGGFAKEASAGGGREALIFSLSLLYKLVNLSREKHHLHLYLHLHKSSIRACSATAAALLPYHARETQLVVRRRAAVPL